MPGHNGLYVGRNRLMGSSVYVSPYLLEILNSSVGFSSQVATGTLIALTGQTVSCSRSASAYCLGNDGLLHLLGANTVRVEPSGLLVEGASTNNIFPAIPAVSTGTWQAPFGGGAPTVTTNSTDVLDPTGANTATKLVYPAINTGQGWLYSLSTATWSNPGLGSIYLRTASGSGTIYLIDRSNNVTACAVDTTWRRFSYSTAVAANPNYFVLGYGNDAGTLGYTNLPLTVYAWGAQLEATPFVTSLIVTTSAPATRDSDIVTVANPLNPSNPGTWHMNGTFTPEGTWAQVGNVDSQSVLLALGTNGAANNARLVTDAASGGRIWADVTDNASAVKTITSSVSNNAPGSSTQTARLNSAAGTLSGSPTLDTPTGTGSGTIATQSATVSIGEPGGLSNFRFWGHMTDVVVDNT